MAHRQPLIAAFSVLFLLVAPSAAGAPSSSLRASFVKESTASIDVQKDGIRVSGYKLARVVRGGDKPFKMGAGPAILFDVKNEGAEKKEFALAVALFDRDGRLVGAGTGGRSGKLDPGESQEVKVIFHDVNQDVPHAATIYMTLEVER